MNQHPAQIRSKELRQKIAKLKKDIAALAARQSYLDEQLTSTNSKTADWGRVSAQERERQAVENDLEELHEALQIVQTELRDATAECAIHERQLTEWRRTIDDLPKIFSNSAVYDPNFWVSDPLFQLHRQAVRAAAGLRLWGVDVPREITITLTLGDMALLPTVMPAQIAEPEEEDDLYEDESDEEEAVPV